MNNGVIGLLIVLCIGGIGVLYCFWVGTDENGCSFQKSFRDFKKERQERRKR